MIDPNGDSIEINGIKISSAALASLLNMITKPDPKHWYRFTKIEHINVIQVECKRED